MTKRRFLKWYFWKLYVNLTLILLVSLTAILTKASASSKDANPWYLPLGDSTLFFMHVTIKGIAPTTDTKMLAMRLQKRKIASRMQEQQPWARSSTLKVFANLPRRQITWSYLHKTQAALNVFVVNTSWKVYYNQSMATVFVRYSTEINQLFDPLKVNMSWKYHEIPCVATGTAQAMTITHQ